VRYCSSLIELGFSIASSCLTIVFPHPPPNHSTVSTTTSMPSSTYITQTSPYLPCGDAPPPYSVSPFTSDPRLTAALAEYEKHQDPAQWGLRRSHPSSTSTDDDLSGFLGWVVWVIEAFAPPNTATARLSQVGTASFMSMSQYHFI